MTDRLVNPQPPDDAAADPPAGLRPAAHSPDQLLLHRLRQGDQQAFTDLVNHYSKELFGLAFSLTGNAADAEDVLQQTFLGAFRRIRFFEGRSTLKTWLAHILANQASKSRRSRKSRQAAPLWVPEGSSAGIPLPAIRSEESAVNSRIDLDHMFEQLSLEHREVLMLRELQGMSYQAISESLRIPRGTVESRLFRARQELRRHFSHQF